MKGSISRLFGVILLLLSYSIPAADIVPPVVEMPGTQPQEVGNLESPDKCDNCHGGYNTAVEPAYNWRGSMMAHAGRDPIFWATLAIAEQDFDGAGDLCIRCHSTAGWLAGRSTPTDGSGLAAGDSDGVECDFCHKMTNPDNSEHQGQMNPGFFANKPTDNPEDLDGTEGFLGSGMASLWAGSDKLGPYDNAGARHQFMHSQFHRDRDFCGTCHDVSNPVVGHAAPNKGTQASADPVCLQTNSECNPNNTGDDRVAFTNPPYAYGIVERTFSEYKSGLISETLVSAHPDHPGTPDYSDLPADLKAGALEAVYNAATQNGTIDGHYDNPPMPRYFSCQTCHMRPVEGKGANKNGIPVRKDLALHDMTGGNYWMPEAIQYQDGQGKLRLGGGMSAEQVSAMEAGALRAREQLELAATLSVSGNTVKIINHTGHKLISGYPEGRRMWLNIKWHDNTGLIHEDGEYGPLDVQVDLDGDDQKETVQVNTILDLEGTNTRIYEAHMGMTKQWAADLVSLGYDTNLALSYDRVTGEPNYTLNELAESTTDTAHETFHFVLNNTVVKDNRIPPYGMRYDMARERNALPVPANQYGGGSPGSTYNYWDEVTLKPPAGATYATIDLLYQPTSWEYIQFLHLANNGNNAFLAEEGDNMLEAWLNTGMAAPHVMASTTWGTPPGEVVCNADAPSLLTADAGVNGEIVITWQEVQANPGPITSYNLYYDQAGKAQPVTTLNCSGDTPGCLSYTDTGLTNGQQYCYKVTSVAKPSDDSDITCESGFSNILCATASQPGLNTSVPDVVNLSQAEAESAITNANLMVGDPVGADFSDTVPEGVVISQQPAPDTIVQEGSSVDIVVSRGPADAVVCSQIPDKGSCNNEPLCEWQGSPKNGMCVDLAVCQPTAPTEVSCTDGIDNDCDGAVDCNDSDCATDLACQPADCSGFTIKENCNAEATCRWDNRSKTCVAN